MKANRGVRLLQIIVGLAGGLLFAIPPPPNAMNLSVGILLTCLVLIVGVVAYVMEYNRTQ